MTRSRLALPRLVAAVGVTAAVLGVLLLVVRSAAAEDASGPRVRPSPSLVGVPRWPEPAAVRAVRVVEEWDAARAAAWRAGDAHALRSLYVPGGGVGRRDEELLRAYCARGLRVSLRTRTDRLAVLVARPGRVVVRRHTGVDAVVRLAERARVVPTGWSWRRLELVRAAGTWRLRTSRDGTPRGPP